jgi:hypothetical protein
MKEITNKQSDKYSDNIDNLQKRDLLVFNLTLDSILSILEDESVLECEKTIISHAYNMGKLEAKMEIESSGEEYFNENFNNNTIEIK